MVWPILSVTSSLVIVVAAHGVTPGGLFLVAILYFGTELTSVFLCHFVTMGPVVAYLGETVV